MHRLRSFLGVGSDASHLLTSRYLLQTALRWARSFCEHIAVAIPSLSRAPRRLAGRRRSPVLPHYPAYRRNGSSPWRTTTTSIAPGIAALLFTIHLPCRDPFTLQLRNPQPPWKSTPLAQTKSKTPLRLPRAASPPRKSTQLSSRNT
jgi:hypothetical protein